MRVGRDDGNRVILNVKQHKATVDQGLPVVVSS